MTLFNFKNINSKNKISIISIIFIITVLLLSIFFIKPTIIKIKDTRDEILKQKIAREKSIIQGKNMSSLTEKLKQIEPKLKEADQIFINKNRELEFITTLEGAANNNNIDQSINLNPINYNNNDFQSVNISINASGKYNDIINYLINLESLSYYINVNSFELMKNPSKTKVITEDLENPGNISSNINIKLTATTYWK